VSPLRELPGVADVARVALRRAKRFDHSSPRHLTVPARRVLHLTVPARLVYHLTVPARLVYHPASRLCEPAA